MAELTAQDKQEIIAQSIREYNHDLRYRQRREHDWLTIDDLYYGKKKKSLVTRANIHVPKMQGTIETYISKIDDEPFIMFDAMEEGDTPKAERLNALIRRDMSTGDWALKDVLGKKQGALYGRAIYKKWSTNEDGFTDFFDVVDVLDFLIDPMAGGLTPIENARHMGHDNIVRSKFDLSDASIYDQEAVERIATKLLSDPQVDNSFASTQKRRQALGLSNAVMVNDDSIKLVEWYTIFEGVWYYNLMSVKAQDSVRLVPLSEVFPSEERPFSTWAPYPRVSEFWTPGVGELVKEPNIVQNVILSQILDNNAYRNYGMKVYDATKVENPDDLTPKPMGKIPVSGKPQDIVMQLQFPTLENAVATYGLVERIYDKETGINENAKGQPNSKRMSATEFAGILDQTADRFFAANKTYRHALRRIALLYKLGVEHNLTKAKRVRILGAQKGVEWVSVSQDDAKAELDIIISTAATDEQNKNLQRDRFDNYVTRNRKNARLNQRFLDEKEALIFGFEPHEIDRLLNPQIEAGWELLAEAAQENEQMLEKDVEANRNATSGHIEKHLVFLKTVQNLSPEVIRRVLKHSQEEVPHAIKNENLNAEKMIREKMGERITELSEVGEGAINDQLGEIERSAQPAEAPLEAPVDVQDQVRTEAILRSPQAGAQI